MTDRKMTDEEVFVGAMNAAIGGLMAALGKDLYQTFEYDKRATGHRVRTINAVDSIVEIAGIAAGFALQQKYEFDEESDG